MKKLILGCTIALIGTIASSSWIVAHAILVGPGAWSDIANMLPLVGSRCGPDGWITFLFGGVAILGVIIAVKAIRDPDKTE